MKNLRKMLETLIHEGLMECQLMLEQVCIDRSVEISIQSIMKSKIFLPIVDKNQDLHFFKMWSLCELLKIRHQLLVLRLIYKVKILVLFEERLINMEKSLTLQLKMKSTFQIFLKCCHLVN